MALIDDLFPLLVSSSRSIGTIIPDVVVEEAHRDVTAITDHPVERGASITDHAFQRPSELQVRCASSNSTAGTEGYVQDVYQEFLELQRAREPFNVSTGKRLYQNMLISSLETQTDQTTENALMLTVGLREILLVDTQTTGSASQSAQANPASTAPEVNTGTKQAVLTNTDRVSIPGGIGGV